MDSTADSTQAQAWPVNRATRRSQRGSTLTEVMVSVLLFSFGVVGLMRVLGTAVQNTGSLQYRSMAATLADSLVGQMWVDQGNLPAHAIDDAAVPELPDGRRMVSVKGSVVTVVISWRAPGTGVRSTHRITATLSGNDK